MEKLRVYEGCEENLLRRIEFTREAILRSYQLLLDYIGEDWLDENSTSPKQNEAHPMVKWCKLFPSWREESEQKGIGIPTEPIVNLALLGQSLEIICSDPKFGKLIARLKNPDEFYATAFEIKVAAAHVEQGLQVEFIEETDNVSARLCT